MKKTLLLLFGLTGCAGIRFHNLNIPRNNFHEKQISEKHKVFYSDKDHDGIPEETLHYEKIKGAYVLKRIDHDWNQDGKIDIVQYFDRGKKGEFVYIQ